MLEIDPETLENNARKIGNVEDDLDDLTKKNKPDSIYGQIAREVDGAIASPILSRARTLGKEHVGDRVASIKPVSGEWTGNTYVAGLRSDNDIVRYQAYGTGKYGGGGPYKITPKGDNLVFNAGGKTVVADVVVHPGVRGKRFVERAVREQIDDVARDTGDAVQSVIEDALDG